MCTRLLISKHVFLVCFGINAYKCHIINFLLTSLARYVERNIGPRSFCTNIALRARSAQKKTSVWYFSVQTSRSGNKKSAGLFHRSRVTGHGSQVTGHRSRVTGHESRVTGHGSQVTGRRFMSTSTPVMLSLSLQQGIFRVYIFSVGSQALPPCGYCWRPFDGSGGF
jgi:hypothetical protein